MNILNELKEISPVLAQIPVAHPYHVPDGYFDGLAEQMLINIKSAYTSDVHEELAALSPMLNRLNKKGPYVVPEGYFNELVVNMSTITTMVNVESVTSETEMLSPAISHLRTKQAYEIPDGYFESLPARVLEKIKHQQPAKVVAGRFNKTAIKFAAAAIIIGFVLISTLLYVMKNSKLATVAPLAGIEKVSSEEIENFLNNQTDPLSDQINLVPDTEDMDESDMKLLLADVSDDELEQYLLIQQTDLEKRSN